MARNVIVVGMPRSGTSMVAGIFGRHGYFAATEGSGELRPGDEHNPGGYWEAESLIEANVRLFEAIGYRHHNTWLFDPIDEGAERAIAAAKPPRENRELLDSYEAKAPWVWKDPRLCYALGGWRSLIDWDTTRVLLIRRSAEAIYHSFRRLEWRDKSDEAREDVLRRVADHVAAADWTIQEFDIPHIALDYEDFQRAPEEIARQIATAFDIPMTVEGLGFSAKLNHDSMSGRLRTSLRRAGMALPQPVRDALKRLLPDTVLRAER